LVGRRNSDLFRADLLLRLLYLSQAVKAEDNDLESILRSARRNNPLLSVTGVLIHGGGWYMQLLEGPEPSVIRLYAQIIEDRRHADPRILHVTPASEVLFREWSMGLVRSNPLEFEHVTALKSKRLETVNASIFAETMKQFLKKLEQQD
jgi:hypothetical protein